VRVTECGFAVDSHRASNMRTHGVVLALGAADATTDALLIDNSSRFLLECGLQPLVYHAVRAIASMKRHACSGITVVAAGDAHAGVLRECIARWRANDASGIFAANVDIDVMAVDEDADTARALAAAEASVDGRTTTLVVVHGDVVTDVALDDMLSHHMCAQAMATCALAGKRLWDVVETKAGRAPKGMRYVGVDAEEQKVVLLAGGERDEAMKRLKLHRSALNSNAEMVIRTDLTDAKVYALEARETFALLKEKTYLRSVQFDLMPYLCAEQFRAEGARAVAAFMVKPENYCVVVDSAKPALLEASREITSEFHHMNDKPLSKYDNVVDGSTVIGAKSTIGPGCAVGAQCSFKEKCSVKKSVILSDCEVGAGVKISNSLILRGAQIGDGAQIQGSIIGPSAVIGARATVKDSIVGAQYEVESDDDITSETLKRKD
jgi:translation initiation factor eIF-2B subunit gamma